MLYNFQEGSPKQISFQLLEKGENLLDLGCGDGEFGSRIKSSGLYDKVFGVDSDERCLSLSTKKGLIVQKVDLSNEKMPFSDDKFDAVIALEVIEHINNLTHLVEEVKRVLCPNGVFILSTPNIQFVYHICRLILGKGPHTSFSEEVEYFGSGLRDSGHVNYFTIRDLKDLLSPLGFEVIVVKGTYNVSNKLLHKIMKSCHKTFLKSFTSPGLVIKSKMKVNEEILSRAGG